MNTSTSAVENQTIEYNSETFTSTTYNGISVIRDSNGYYQASKICKDNGKRLQHWFDNINTQELLNEYANDLNLDILHNDYSELKSQLGDNTEKLNKSEEAGIPASYEIHNNTSKTIIPFLIYRRFKGYAPTLQGYYIHPKLVNALCMWCNVRYWIKVNHIMDLINEEIELRNIDLENKLSEMEQINRSLKEDKKQLTSANVKLVEMNKELSNNYDELTIRYNDVTTDNDELFDENQDLKMEVKQLNNTIDELEENNSSLTDEIETLRTELDDVKLLAVPKSTADKYLMVIHHPQFKDRYNEYQLSANSTRPNDLIVKNDGHILAQYKCSSAIQVKEYVYKSNLTDQYGNFSFTSLNEVIKKVENVDQCRVIFNNIDLHLSNR